MTIKNKNYQVFFKNPTKALPAIAKEIKKSGNTLRLLVYPNITYYPGKEDPHRVQFQIVAWSSTSDEPNGLFAELQDLEFLLSGLWQLIPVCKTPCVTVFKNYLEERVGYLNKSDALKRKNILKAIHVPMLSHDSLGSPNNNPNTTPSNQNKQNYLSIKTRFLPSSDLWEFDSFIV
ncbi:MAG: hypothetical protein ACYTXE_40610 [Nostoc sp.]